VLFVLLLCPSRSVLTFFTSGLENPLALLLLAAIVLYADRMDGSQRAATRGVLLLSLLALTRLDLVLLGAPIVLLKLRRSTVVRALLLGGIPFVAWELFSLVYYGSFVPNTAYAKLATGIPHEVILRQGVKYFRTLGLWDAWGALLLGAGTGVALVTRRTLALGLVLYGVYLVWIGGDFMAGRFFSTPIVLATFCLCEARWGRVVYVAAIFTLPLLFIDRLDAEQPPFEQWLRGEGGHWEEWGVADERQFWASSTGLFTAARPRDVTKHPLYRFARRADDKLYLVESCIGMVGFYARRDLHIIDPLGLSDPLLARLPVVNPGLFRIGHFEREVPSGYAASALRGIPLLADPDLRAYDAVLLTITRGPIFSTDRVRAIATLLSGRAEPLRLAYVRRYRASQRR
jgi:arabinofuranosyltransferase